MFLSYASENLEMVRKVYEGLKKRNVDAWFDKGKGKKRLGPGDWKSQIEKAIVSSRYFVICISEVAINKLRAKSVQEEELHWAYKIAMVQPETTFTIIPVRLEDCDRGDNRLSVKQQYDLFPDFESGLDDLAVDIGGISLADSSAKDTRSEEEKAVQVLLGKAMTSWYAKDYEKALSLSYSATLLHPASAEIWLKYGTCLTQLGRHKEALETYDKAIRLKPDDANAWICKGLTLADLGRHKEAVEAYDKVIELKPDDAVTWYFKGSALNKLDRYEEALEAFDMGIGLQPDVSAPWIGKALAFAVLGRHEEAREAFSRAEELEMKRK